MTVSTILSELLIPWQPNMVWWYIIIRGFRVKVTVKVKMLMYVQMISSKPPNILFPNLVLWCIIMSLSVMQKDWFAILKVKVTARAHMIKCNNFYCLFWTADPFATRLGLIVHCHKPGCFKEKLDCFGQGHSKISKTNVCPDYIFWYAESFTIKLCIVVHHYEQDCLSRRLVCYIQDQGHIQE